MIKGKTMKSLELQAFGQKNKSDSFNTNGIKIIRLIWLRTTILIRFQKVSQGFISRRYGFTLH